MPKFCRHNRLVQNCPICSREQAVELRPLVSSSTPREAEPSARVPRPAARREPRRATEPRGVTVRRLRTSVDDGYRSPLVPGLRSSQEARRLAVELAFATTRLRLLEADPPGLYAEVADPGGDLEERTWLAFLIAYLYPLEREDPFAAIASARTSWESGEPPRLQDVETGPRSPHQAGRGLETVQAYRAWAGRAGSQAQAMAGDPSWSPERRFARTFERLALPGLQRDARYEFLVSLGGLGVYELRAGMLALTGSGEVSTAAKRALGIADPLLLARRAGQLAEACAAPLAALDLALYNWDHGERVTGGLGPGAEPETSALQGALAALGL